MTRSATYFGAPGTYDDEGDFGETEGHFNAATAFDDLEDEAFWADAPSENTVPFAERAAQAAPEVEIVGGATYTQRCDRCGGSGAFIGRNGRRFGDCFACKGKGVKTFKTSPAERAKAKAARDPLAKAVAWLEAHPAERAWLGAAKARGFRFADKMFADLDQYGSLTDGKIAAIRRFMAEDAARDAQRAQAQAARVTAAPKVDLSKVAEAFAKASGIAQEAAAKKGGWLRQLRLRVAGFVIKPAPATGRNPGALYVTRAADGEYLGKLQDGAFQRKAFVCDDATEAAIVEVCADPAAAAVAYGRLTGACAICGRQLDNHESIARGIGPICADKWGF